MFLVNRHIIFFLCSNMFLKFATAQNLFNTILTGNSGATFHMHYYANCMFDLAPCQTVATVRNNETLTSQVKGCFKGTFRNTNYFIIYIVAMIQYA
jgi:hypothetical protein